MKGVRSLNLRHPMVRYKSYPQASQILVRVPAYGIPTQKSKELCIFNNNHINFMILIIKQRVRPSVRVIILFLGGGAIRNSPRLYNLAPLLISDSICLVKYYAVYSTVECSAQYTDRENLKEYSSQLKSCFKLFIHK